MKKIFLLLSLSFAGMFSQAQTPGHDVWTIKLNKKVILQAFKPGETANTRVIKLSDLGKRGSLEIIYQQADTKQESAWKRSFMLMDENDKELLRKDSTLHATIPNSELKKLFGDKKKVSIYTIAIPVDVNLAARIRVRRIQLCTLVLQ